MKHFSSLVLVMGLFLGGCGTDSGNPTATPTQGAIAADFIGGQVCTKLRTCFGTALPDCRTDLLEASGFSAQLGVNTTTFPDLFSVIVGVDDSVLSLNTDQQQICHTWIDNLACASADVQNSFDPNSPNDLSKAFLLLAGEAACGQMVQ